MSDTILMRVQKTNIKDWECPHCEATHEFDPDDPFIKCYKCRVTIDARLHGTIGQPWIPLYRIPITP